MLNLFCVLLMMFFSLSSEASQTKELKSRVDYIIKVTDVIKNKNLSEIGLNPIYADNYSFGKSGEQISTSAIDSLKSCYKMYTGKVLLQKNEEDFFTPRIFMKSEPVPKIESLEKYCESIFKNGVKLSCVESIFQEEKNKTIKEYSGLSVSAFFLGHLAPRVRVPIEIANLNSINACYLNEDLKKRDIGRIMFKNKNLFFGEDYKTQRVFDEKLNKHIMKINVQYHPITEVEKKDLNMISYDFDAEKQEKYEKATPGEQAKMDAKDWFEDIWVQATIILALVVLLGYIANKNDIF